MKCRCDNCKWWNETGHMERPDDGVVAGFCHRYPPQGAIKEGFEQVSETWADFYCGEFKEKEEEQ